MSGLVGQQAIQTAVQTGVVDLRRLDVQQIVLSPAGMADETSPDVNIATCSQKSDLPLGLIKSGVPPALSGRQ